MESVVAEAARFLAARAAEPLRLGDVADHVGYSPFHLARAFEQRIGMPPGRFLATHRFQRAKRLLLESDDERVIDVCHRAGFTAPGTFTARFAGFVGSSPTEFRRLPHLLYDAPPRPTVVPGSAGSGKGGSVAGRVALSAEASALLGASPAVYVGLFTRQAARGFPVSGALLAGPGEFLLTGVPWGRYFLLGSALPARRDFAAQLVPDRTVAGRAAMPVRLEARAPSRGADLVLDVLPDWAPPVLVALPFLASSIAQDWRRRRPF